MPPLSIFLQQESYNFIETLSTAMDDCYVTDFSFEAHFEKRVEELRVPSGPSVWTSQI
jgi:hypothetical protein